MRICPGKFTCGIHNLGRTIVLIAAVQRPYNERDACAKIWKNTRAKEMMTLVGAGSRAARSPIGPEFPSFARGAPRASGSASRLTTKAVKETQPCSKIYLVGDLLRPREHLLRDHHRGAPSFKNRKNLPMHTHTHRRTHVRARKWQGTTRRRRRAERSRAERRAE